MMDSRTEQLRHAMRECLQDFADSMDLPLAMKQWDDEYDYWLKSESPYASELMGR